MTLALQLVSIALIPRMKKSLMALNHLNARRWIIKKVTKVTNRRPTDGAGRRPCEVWRTLLILIGELDL